MSIVLDSDYSHPAQQTILNPLSSDDPTPIVIEYEMVSHPGAT